MTSTASASNASKASAATTEAMLREIRSGTAAEAVMGVRYTTSPPGPTFIPTLDELLLEGRPHRAGSTLQKGDLVELVGPSGSGKTSLLIFILFTSLLPPTLPPPARAGSSEPGSIPLGGRGAHAVLIYPRYHRSLIPRIAQSMRDHIRVCAPSRSLDSELVEQVVEESMGRLRVFRVGRWREVALALRAAALYGRGSSAKAGDDAEQEQGSVDIAAIDGLGDGWYPHKWADEQRGKRSYTSYPSRNGVAGAGAGAGGKVINAEDVGMKEIMEGIGRLRKECGSVVFVSVQALRLLPTSPFPAPHLPYPYPSPYHPTSDSDPDSSSSSTTFPSTSTSTPNPTTPTQSGYKASPTFWPLTAQIALSGRTRGLQLPGETTLVDALVLRIKSGHGPAQAFYGGTDGADGAAGQSVRYDGTVRMPVVSHGTLGSRTGTRFRFKIAQGGVEVWNDQTV